jgi:hypothetical protein
MLAFAFLLSWMNRMSAVVKLQPRLNRISQRRRCAPSPRARHSMTTRKRSRPPAASPPKIAERTPSRAIASAAALRGDGSALRRGRAGDHRAEGLRRRRGERRHARRSHRDARGSADGSIGQIPQNHFFMLEALRLQGSRKSRSASSMPASWRASASATRCRRSAPRRRRITRRASPATGRSIASTARNSIRPACSSPIGSPSSPTTTTTIRRSPSCRATPRASRSSTIGRASASASPARARRSSTMSKCILFSVFSLRAVVRQADLDGAGRPDHACGVEAGIARAALAETIAFVGIARAPGRIPASTTL